MIYGVELPKHRSFRVRNDSMQRIIVIVTGLVGSGLLVLGIVMFSSAPAGSAQSAPSVAVTPKPRKVQTGTPVIVGLLEDDDPEQLICMVREIKDREEVERLVATRDTEGMRQALGRLRATLIPNRSPALLLEVGHDLCRVRILEGPVRGREGWVPPEYLLREAR